MELNKIKVENFFKPFIIAEVGANHNGDIDLAKRMIDKAKECGADAVKFQSWNTSSLISKSEYKKNTSYEGSKKKHFGSLLEMVEKYQLTPDMHYELAEYCKTKEIAFCSTPFSKEEVDLLEEVNVPFYKIASMDINNIVLLKYIAKKNKPIIISTGMSSLSEIDSAINAIKSEGNNRIVLLHCISIYPPKLETINLRNIQMLNETFGLVSGFSDHSIGTIIPIAAMTLGAAVIEKHFTLDKDLPGWDHEVSADPDELKEICNARDQVYKALGNYMRKISSDEEKKKSSFRRSIVAARDIQVGEILSENDILFKRPGTGISPNRYLNYIGRKISRNISKDDLLSEGDFI